MPGKLPVTIFTGFLGAGKTTLLKNLVKSEREKSFAVVINEFGAVSVDDLLVKEGAQPDNIEIYKLSGGLIAYEGDEFRQIMAGIARRAAQFDHVLIETSGLAAPTAAMEALNSPELQDRFSLDATLALVDTPLFLAEDTLSEATLAVLSHQLRAADVVVLNKIDGIEKVQLSLAESKVRDLAPDVRFIELAWQAKLDSRLSLGLHLNEFRATEHVAGLPAFTAHLHQTVDGHSHSGLGAHDHGLNTHQHLHEEDPGWVSFSLFCRKRQEKEKLKGALESVARQLPLMRVKGFVNCLDEDAPVLFQGVNQRILIDSRHPEQSHERKQIQLHSHTHTHEHSHEHQHSHHHEHEHEHRHEHDHDHDHEHEHHHHHEHEHEHHHHHEHSNDGEHNSSLVFIGYHLDRTRLSALLNSLTGSHWH